MTEVTREANRLATVFGGSGFLGRYIVRALVHQGWRIRVAVRRPDLAAFLQPIGGVGQIQPVQANLRFPDSIAAAVEGANAVINATGVTTESGAQTYTAVHVDGALALAKAAAAAGASSYVHISGIGADPNSASPYVASKGLGENATRETLPGAVVLRPSVVFGPEDEFFNRFGALACYFPALPLLAGGGARLQPVYVGDVAQAVAASLSGVSKPGAIYELGGPRIMTLREAAELTLSAIDRRRMLVGLPLGPSRWMAGATQFASKITFGLFPHLLTTTRDQVDLLASDNVVSPEAEAEGRVLSSLGVQPQAAEAIILSYLTRFRRTGQYEVLRSD
ncbi:MAG: complex I NDUFA9 subunit family protein [Hyphomicrobiales bacterium]|nr:complex I NDUFA9 subunit family protein [Hyphomicrobiales bacterium]MBV9910123.1 complex I NDUFA9 subunit family protein [Hyphomicrobiales bacterium]